MDVAFEIAKFISTTGFVFFGMSCLVSARTAIEFDRYGMSKWRRLTGLLQIAGALGIAADRFVPQLTILGSGGLALMMGIAIGIRIRLGDSLWQDVPALLFLSLNSFILFVALMNS